MNLGTESRAVSTGAHEGSDQRVADRRWFRGLLAFCIFATLATLWIGKDRDHIRNPDEAACAEQARAMLDRGTLEGGFVRHYHVQYPADVLHTEDFYPPGNGALIAASWSVFGRSDFTSTIGTTPFRISIEATSTNPPRPRMRPVPWYCCPMAANRSVGSNEVNQVAQSMVLLASHPTSQACSIGASRCCRISM